MVVFSGKTSWPKFQPAPATPASQFINTPVSRPPCSGQYFTVVRVPPTSPRQFTATHRAKDQVAHFDAISSQKRLFMACSHAKKPSRLWRQCLRRQTLSKKSPFCGRNTCCMPHRPYPDETLASPQGRSKQHRACHYRHLGPHPRPNPIPAASRYCMTPAARIQSVSAATRQKALAWILST